MKNRIPASEKNCAYTDDGATCSEPRRRGRKDGEVNSSYCAHHASVRNKPRSNGLHAIRTPAIIQSLGGTCHDVDAFGIGCAETEHLEMDHIDQFSKAHEMGSIIPTGRMGVINNELQKCQALCGPHHKDKTARDAAERAQWARDLRSRGEHVPKSAERKAAVRAAETIPAHYEVGYLVRPKLPDHVIVAMLARGEDPTKRIYIPKDI